jgi:alkylation response protein AidB-like acyl-CoA dehydrogenase
MFRGVARSVADGWRVTARKRFVSGSPTGDLLMTTAVDAASGPEPTVLHFALPLAAAGMSVQDNWRTLGMRGTGSHDVVVEDVHVPAAAVSIRRPAGKWVSQFHLMQMDRAPTHRRLLSWRGRGHARPCGPNGGEAGGQPWAGGYPRRDAHRSRGARIAHRDIVEAAFTLEPGPDTLNRVFIDRTLVGLGVLRVAERAMEAAGGSAFYRAAGLDRLLRDIQGVRYHRPQERMQVRYTGELALGRDPSG